MLRLPLILLCLHVYIACSVPQSEMDALVSIYEATGGNNWKCGARGGSNCSTEELGGIHCTSTNISIHAYGLGAWGSGEVCSWFGVACADDRVIGLCLRANNLVGQLGPMDLPNIVFINLFNNALSGTLPREWSSWTKIELFTMGHNYVKGSLPSEWSTWRRLKFFALEQNQLSGSLPSEWSTWEDVDVIALSKNAISGSFPSTWQLPSLSVLQLNNNNMTAFDLANFPKFLDVLTISCQNSSIIDTRRCPNSISSSSLLKLNSRIPSLQVIDVQNTTATFIRAPTWYDYSASVYEVQKWGGLAIVCTLGFIAVVAGVVEALYVGGYCRVSLKNVLLSLDYRGGVRRSAVVGGLVLVAIFVALYFVVVEVWTYRYTAQVEDAYTGPFEAYDMTDQVNFTFALSLGGGSDYEVLTVSDAWYTQQRKYLGSAVGDTEIIRYFSRPVGWSINGTELERSIEFSFNLSSSGGFNWTLGVTSGPAPGHRGALLPSWWESPHLRGAFTGVRHDGAIDVNTDFDNFSLSDLAGYQVPNRLNASGWEENLKSCLKYVSINVLATPFNVSVEEDHASGTREQRYQTYLLSEAVESQGVTQQAAECGPTTVGLTITRKDFMVNRRVYRTEGIVPTLSKLLGAMAGITKFVDVATRAYVAVQRWRMRRKSKSVELIVSPAEDEEECSSWSAQTAWNRSLRTSLESLLTKNTEHDAMISRIESRLRAVEMDKGMGK